MATSNDRTQHNDANRRRICCYQCQKCPKHAMESYRNDDYACDDKNIPLKKNCPIALNLTEISGWHSVHIGGS